MRKGFVVMVEDEVDDDELRFKLKKVVEDYLDKHNKYERARIYDMIW